jgi:PAS domain S-box-containing protein
MLALSGYEESEFVGKPTSILKSGEMSDDYYARLWRSVLAGEVWEEIIINRNAQGELYRAFQTISPVLDDDGHLTGMIGIQRDISRESTLNADLGRVQTEVEKLLTEKETLLKEVYHRVKNDMALTASLLRLQSREVEDLAARRLLEDAASRSDVLARMYGFMREAAEARVFNADELLREISETLTQSTLPHRTELSVEVGSFRIGGRTATALTILINELCVNAAKYAFPGLDAPRLHIALEREPTGHLRLRVSDNGPGLPKAIVSDRDYGFGLSIIEMIASQYDGSLSVSNDDGAKIELRLKDRV